MVEFVQKIWSVDLFWAFKLFFIWFVYIKLTQTLRRPVITGRGELLMFLHVFFFFCSCYRPHDWCFFYKPSRKFFFLKLKNNCIALYSNNRRSFIKQRGSIGCIELFAQFIFLFEFIARKKRYKVVGPVPTFYFKTMNWFFFFSCCLYVFFSIHY